MVEGNVSREKPAGDYREKRASMRVRNCFLFRDCGDQNVVAKVRLQAGFALRAETALAAERPAGFGEFCVKIYLSY